jgi:hypothetical protein
VPFNIDPTTGALFAGKPPQTRTETDVAAAMADVSERGQNPNLQQRSAKKGGPPKRSDYVDPNEWIEAVRKWRTDQEDSPAGSAAADPDPMKAGRKKALQRMQ